jgi:predicted nucleic acid-binding protein
MAEAVYLLQRAGLPHVARGLLKQATGETLLLLQLDGSDIPSINAILAKYEDQRFQLADACLMHLANREGIDTVFTLDRKDFEVYKPQTFAALRLLPE